MPITANQAGLANHIEANSLIPLIRGDISGARLIPHNFPDSVLDAGFNPWLTLRQRSSRLP